LPAIHPTAPVSIGAAEDPATRRAQHDSELDDAARAMIAEADTFFVASYVDVEGERSVDVSHRGGQSGFVQVEGNRLTIPDFAGNLFSTRWVIFWPIPRRFVVHRFQLR
jgi:predicted pyridoxine 5'-phosphate oxidase superfamily flavin-nucleotide-binding protein